MARILGVILLMSFLLVPVLSNAQQQTGQIIGRVVDDATGEPLVGACCMSSEHVRVIELKAKR